MYGSFEERRRRRGERRDGPSGVVSGAEYLTVARRGTSSEARLATVPRDSWTPDVFREATRAFYADSGFRVSLHRKGEALPPRAPDLTISYWTLYDEAAAGILERDDLLVSVVVDGERVVGFGIAEGRNPSEIKIIAVEQCSNRSNGVQRTIEVAGEQFGVGIAHVVVDVLVEGLTPPVTTNATSEVSGYVFKSLGFEQDAESSNPCLLRLRAGGS